MSRLETCMRRWIRIRHHLDHHNPRTATRHKLERALKWYFDEIVYLIMTRRRRLTMREEYVWAVFAHYEHWFPQR